MCCRISPEKGSDTLADNTTCQMLSVWKKENERNFFCFECSEGEALYLYKARRTQWEAIKKRTYGICAADILGVLQWWCSKFNFFLCVWHEGIQQSEGVQTSWGIDDLQKKVYNNLVILCFYRDCCWAENVSFLHPRVTSIVNALNSKHSI